MLVPERTKFPQINIIIVYVIVSNSDQFDADQWMAWVPTIKPSCFSAKKTYLYIYPNRHIDHFGTSIKLPCSNAKSIVIAVVHDCRLDT